MNTATPNRTLALHRKVSMSFRDTALLKVGLTRHLSVAACSVEVFQMDCWRSWSIAGALEACGIGAPGARRCSRWGLLFARGPGCCWVSLNSTRLGPMHRKVSP